LIVGCTIPREFRPMPVIVPFLALPFASIM
jgi:hypothetical protein